MISQRSSSKRILSLLGLISLLVVAFILDQWVESARAKVATTFIVLPAIALMTFGYLLLASGIVAVLWYIDFQGERDLLVASVYLIVGGLISMNSIVVALLSLIGYSVVVLSYLFRYTLPDSRLYVTAIFITIGGVIGFLRRKAQ